MTKKPREQWFDIVRTVREHPDQIPFAEQWRRFRELETDLDASAGPLPAWVPGEAETTRSNIARLTADLGLSSYADLHRWSVSDRGAFWSALIDRLGVPIHTAPARIFDAENPKRPEWLDGATLDVSGACFTAAPAQPAIITGREGSDERRTVTFGELEVLVDRAAHGVSALGLEPGAGVALYMPMTVECVAAYLGIVRAGHPVVSIADSFAPEEVIRRVRLGSAGAIITVDTFRRGRKTIDLYAKVREAGAPPAVVISKTGRFDRMRPEDCLWDHFLGPATTYPSTPRPPSAITNILFSSGTTGDPKAIPWTQLTPIKCAADGHLHQDIHPGDVVAWPTNIGWMMGPWLIYAALVNGAAIALFEGLPSGPAFTEFVERAGVTMLGVVPSLVRAWRDSGAGESVDWSGVRVFSSTGEPSNREDSLWLMSRSGYRAPVIEYCGGTEIGGGYITGTVVQPCAPATFTTPALGLDFAVLDEEGRPVPEGREGEVFLVPPSIGLSETLLNRDHDTVYFDDCPTGPSGETLRRHGDQLRRLPGGFWRAQGRADDTMNLGGIKVSSKELERVIETHPAVFEAAAVSVQPSGEGAEQLVVFVHPADPDLADDLQPQLQQAVSDTLNPLFRIRDLVVVPELPRTASGKLMRRVLRREYVEGGRILNFEC